MARRFGRKARRHRLTPLARSIGGSRGQEGQIEKSKEAYEKSQEDDEEGEEGNEEIEEKGKRVKPQGR